ncbi:hypothetical protein [Bacillus sp. AFS088145]|uniref:hypothetical protein n=1 Tax=Bacillus sp. AFS088145 TaxID=2033514 RepID=UPI000BF5856C|nr:hypothetical protein [Bacillus sp. AFS088145]PFH92690.1 hypothetical protein COI44_00430 [Bacillus sp. AFS088145]
MAKKKLNLTKKNILVSVHVLAVCAWFGGTLSLIILGLYLKNAQNSEQLIYTLSSMHIIDENLLKYPALATLVTGILLSVWTQWGLVKHYWVVIKLVLTVLIILIGIFLINDWFAYLVKTAEGLGVSALNQNKFESTWLSIIITGIFNLSCLAFMTFITYFKPFGKIKRIKKWQHLKKLLVMEF